MATDELNAKRRAIQGVARLFDNETDTCLRAMALKASRSAPLFVDIFRVLKGQAIDIFFADILTFLFDNQVADIAIVGYHRSFVVEMQAIVATVAAWRISAPR